MKDETLNEVKDGLFLCLLGSDKPIVEPPYPNGINQEEALERQFKGMTDIPFTYKDYESLRNDTIRKVNACLTDEDKDFIISFEEGPPQWELCCAGDLSRYLSVQWKLLNIEKPKKQSQKKFQEGIDKLKTFFEKMM